MYQLPFWESVKDIKAQILKCEPRVYSFGYAVIWISQCLKEISTFAMGSNARFYQMSTWFVRRD